MKSSYGGDEYFADNRMKPTLLVKAVVGTCKYKSAQTSSIV